MGKQFFLDVEVFMCLNDLFICVVIKVKEKDRSMSFDLLKTKHNATDDYSRKK